MHVRYVDGKYSMVSKHGGKFAGPAAPPGAQDILETLGVNDDPFGVRGVSHAAGAWGVLEILGATDNPLGVRALLYSENLTRSLPVWGQCRHDNVQGLRAERQLCAYPLPGCVKLERDAFPGAACPRTVHLGCGGGW